MTQKKRNKCYVPKVPKRVPWWDTATPMTEKHRDSVETDVRMAMAAIADGSGSIENIATLWVQLKLARALLSEIEDGETYDDEIAAGQEALVRIAQKVFSGGKHLLNADIMAAGKAVDLSITVTNEFSRLEIMNRLRTEMRKRGIEDEFNKKEMALWIKQRLLKA